MNLPFSVSGNLHSDKCQVFSGAVEVLRNNKKKQGVWRNVRVTVGYCKSLVGWLVLNACIKENAHKMAAMANKQNVYYISMRMRVRGSVCSPLSPVGISKISSTEKPYFLST